MNCYQGPGEVEIDRGARATYLGKARSIAQGLGDEAAREAIRRTLITLPPEPPPGG